MPIHKRIETFVVDASREKTAKTRINDPRLEWKNGRVV